MVTARDLGSGVHPRNKSGYGHRAAQVALGFAYEQEVEIYGPIYASHKVEGRQDSRSVHARRRRTGYQARRRLARIRRGG